MFDRATDRPHHVLDLPSAIPREPGATMNGRPGGGGAILAREAAFSQKPFSMEDREKRRARGRINVGASSGGGFLVGVKKALGLAPGRSGAEEKDDVGMNSIQVRLSHV